MVCTIKKVNKQELNLDLGDLGFMLVINYMQLAFLNTLAFIKHNNLQIM